MMDKAELEEFDYQLFKATCMMRGSKVMRLFIEAEMFRHAKKLREARQLVSSVAREAGCSHAPCASARLRSAHSLVTRISFSLDPGRPEFSEFMASTRWRIWLVIFTLGVAFVLELLHLFGVLLIDILSWSWRIVGGNFQ